MLDQRSDRMPDPTSRPENEPAEFIIPATIGVLGALFLASTFVGLVLL